MNKWDERGLSLARHVALWSRDPSTQVGAYLVDQFNRPISFGFNGLPRGVNDTSSRLETRDIKLKMTIHAEENAILFAARPLQGLNTTLYVWPLPPCGPCAAKIIQVGVSRVVVGIARPDSVARWSFDIAAATQMFEEAGVIYQEVIYP
jgi:dCMP deaminase